MKKLAIVLFMVFLLSVVAVGCVSNTPDTPNFISEETTAGNFYNINGVMKDIGDFSEIEESFLKDFKTNYLPITGISADKVFLYDASELTAEMLESRQGTIIVERCIGMVTDKESGDGCILNFESEDGGYYIAYRNDDCQSLDLCDGTILVSYMVYDPTTDYVDDIMERYDFVVCREYED